MAELSPWNRSIQDLFAELGTSPAGLPSDEAARRSTRYGPNEIGKTKPRPGWVRFLGRFANPLVLILLLASAVSAATGDIASFVIIFCVITLSVTLDFTQELRAQNAIEALRQKVALRARVLRDGSETALPVEQLVPGDIVRLIAGDLIPADGRLIAAKDFFVNQALLTGEAYPVEKRSTELAQPSSEPSAATNMAFAGTSVISGTATLLICRTGREAVLGQIAGALAAKPPPRAFELGVRQFGELLLRITFLLVLFVLAESIAFGRAWLESLLFALALAVGLTPELLPMILTVTLARGAVQLARRQVIVKRLAAIHNLGAMDVLCTDKTGTLTEARIRLMGHIGCNGTESERVFELAYLNSYFETGLKNPLDNAILEHGPFDGSGYQKLDEVPFDFERRRISVLLEKDGQRLLIVKGAPEDILSLSTSVEGEDARAQPMMSGIKADLLARFQSLSAKGLRALAIATRAVPSSNNGVVASDEAGLTFAGFVVFLDPPKVSAGAAVRALDQAGVTLKIVTGDNEQVARHVCGELGIPVVGVLTGDRLAGMTDEALLGTVKRANLFCRITPQQKLRVLEALKHGGQVVGFLGDGINDAPALHAADVGISVDSATDVAKAAAEIVLLDKDLTVLHDGVVGGRRTVVNVDKYILMASSANFGNILSMALAGLFLPFLPLLPIQVLLTNFIYDVTQLGLPFDYVDREVVARPLHWNIRLIERFMLVMGPVSTVFDLITFAVLMFVLQVDEMQFRTGWFIESLVTQILMIFAVRTRRHMFASRPAMGVAALAAGGSVLTVALPFLPIGAWFGFVVPVAPYFGFLVFAVLGFLVLVEVVKRTFYALAGAGASNLEVRSKLALADDPEGAPTKRG
jgi:P-type Mg2+ transporter